MNEYNIDQEEPDHHWNSFKAGLFICAGILTFLILLTIKYC